jgi:hypothetical protein
VIPKHVVAAPRRALAAFVVLAALLAAACSSGGGDAPADASTGAVAAGEAGLASGYPRFVDADAGLTVVLGTPDLAVGTQRVAFVLSDAQGLVRLPLVSVATDIEGAAGAGESAQARFYEFPEGIRGIYVTALTFDRPGTWRLEVTFPLPDGAQGGTSFPLEIAAQASAPSVGDLAPASRNRTLRDVEDVHQLSTGAEPDPALYEQTIAEALAEQRPLVVVFASPGFCTNALCGPQDEVASALRERYPDEANFIHVDLYENPEEIRTGGLDIAIETPLLDEWGLETAEWTFVIDAAGIVAARFESFTPEVELEQALIEVLERS